jgi:hypothetical protein
MSTGKKVLLVLLTIFVVIQFIRPSKNQSSTLAAADIFQHFTASEDVKQLVKTSCYDCHSNNTVYPWYSNIQPVAWWLSNHIKEGKKELNFSEFATYSAQKQNKKLKEVAEEVKENEMPLPPYSWVHTDSRLSDQQKQSIVSWAEGVAKK